MITNNPGANPNPSYNNPTPAPRSNRTGFIVAIAILAIAAIGLLVTSISQNQAKTELSSKYNESEKLKADLEKQYYSALSELEEMKGSNEELNSLIEKQKEELTTQKNRIDVLLKDSRNLGAARTEMKNLRAQVQQYVAEINQLKQQNQELTTQNTTLNEEKNTLTTNLEQERTARTEVETQRATLVSEKETLEADKAALTNKVTFASVIKASGITVEGMRAKSNGKFSKERSAKDVDQLNICFNTTANEVAEAGNETYHIRVIDPQGVTLSVQDLGSGVFKSSSTGEELAFTTAKEFDYNQTATNLCTTWAPNQPFTKGTYKVEVYNKGHLAGSTSFSLK
jgi:regulator of replication initiation timing